MFCFNDRFKLNNEIFINIYKNKVKFMSWFDILVKPQFISRINFINKSSLLKSDKYNIVNMKSIVSFLRSLMYFTVIFIVVNILSVADASEPLRNPYEVLGVTRHATIQDIRKAYKNLVKEWHPDKTDHPGAENKFVEITKAYELLSDPERRRKFDNHGITEEHISRPKQSNYFHKTDPLDELFSGGNFKFHYQTRDLSFFHKMSISYRTYENNVVPKSYRTPYFILFYYDWCFTCFQIEPTWRRLIDELEPIGVKLVTAHAEREPSFARRVSVHSVPCLAITLDGRTSIYKDSLFSEKRIVEFLRNKFPYKLFQNINDNNIDQFLSGWVDNKIRALIFEKRDSPRLRYLLVAFHHRERVAFGFVQLGKPETEAIALKYKIPKDMNTLLLFNENSEKPMASVSMKDISSETMHNVIKNNNYLTLPRLSNQAMLDSVCPPEWLKPQKRLCAILVSQNSAIHDLARHKFRQAAMESPYSTERVRYTYIFKESQPEFVAALSASEGSPMEPLLHIVIIWRRDVNNLKYEWLKTQWVEPTQDENKWNESRRNLEQTIQRLLRISEALPYAAKIEELADEHAQGTVDKIIGRALLAVDYISDNISKEHVLPLISVIATLVLIGAAGYGMSYLVKLEEISIKMKKGDYENNSKPPQLSSQLRLHELRAEKYNGLVRLLKPGCRTIILLVDHQSRLKLIPAFHKAIWPYRKNKTLMFSYMNMERGLNWYKKLLSLSLPDLIELNINPKNCVGTVLALNGHRKYFCIYHAKHPECNKDKESKRMERITKQMSQRSDDAEAGAFIGFDNSSDSEISQDEMKNNLPDPNKPLAGLPNWLDRLFEGSTQRYHVNYWPDFTAK
ncbi:dnaJ homolog subfamily C member 16 [Microplitis mediator]|uniref:dnaJ homolog subfamily C member 16 n=1 Tax=Microplitis mediator TaxID=375433 RepID=UPI00255739DD|nr:dnaJ homolog subfamily C member 16 [Microplitis mediator]